MTDREDIDMLAAEFVLGTLDASERAAVTARRRREAALDEAIVAWEGRLAPLIATVGERVPGPELLHGIERRIDALDSPHDPRSSVVELASVRARLGRWRMAAIAASVVAVLLGGVLGINRDRLLQRPQTFVAVFNQGDRKPTFLMSVDLASRRLVIRPIDAQSHDDKSYQLWIVSEQLGPGPQSLGLLDSPSSPTQKELDEYDPALLQNATFGISLEPKGGSPTGRPTGPALHGQLLPVTQ